jgi:hypothetical protein
MTCYRSHPDRSIPETSGLLNSDIFQLRAEKHMGDQESRQKVDEVSPIVS